MTQLPNPQLLTVEELRDYHDMWLEKRGEKEAQILLMRLPAILDTLDAQQQHIQQVEQFLNDFYDNWKQLILTSDAQAQELERLREAGRDFLADVNKFERSTHQSMALWGLASSRLRLQAALGSEEAADAR